MTRDYFLSPFEERFSSIESDPFFQNRLQNFFQAPASRAARFGFPRLSLSDKPFDFANKSSSLLTSLSPFQSTTDGIQSDNKEPGKFTVNVPLGGNIGPEDLKVSLKDHIVTIEAKKEVKTEDGNTSSRVYQEFSRKFNLPPEVDMKDVRSMLTPEGNLKIEAPLPQKALPAPPQKRERDIAIRME